MSLGSKKKGGTQDSTFKFEVIEVFGNSGHLPFDDRSKLLPGDENCCSIGTLKAN